MAILIEHHQMIYFDGAWNICFLDTLTIQLVGLKRQPTNAERDVQFSKPQTQRYGFFFRITTAKKPETRGKRIADFAMMLKRGEKLH